MELQFLGTSSGTPTRTRNVAGLALRTAGGWVLVDCGEGTQHRILRTNHSPHDLRAIFITHLHGDHCYGLPGLLASAGLLNRTAPLAIVGPAPLERYVRGVMETTALQLPYPVEFIDVEDAARDGLLSDLAVSATPLSHRIPSYAYGFTEKAVERRLDADRLAAAGVPRGPLWGALQAGNEVTLPDGRAIRPADVLQPPRRPRRIVIAGDNDTPALLADAVRDAHVLVHEATYTEAILAKVGPGPQHSSALRVARFAREAAIPNLVLTHFSPRYQDTAGPLTLADIEAEARTEYTGNLFLARDLARHALDREGMLSESPRSQAPGA
ncbi:ribonuclease Z [Pseudoduganella umbonata]|uniref:Ribonuclease Z n=1 Tax=Pseudoduganella umbonata TaxID=864828 RepID=A0A4P8HIB7_9BURK|nr:ribonuclease Z [Pseudoduganella umbonata]MBB3219267.1 ribonuclease Z [Pseudoduganella umbonata]QCP09379.1 ribonuclease Z [Pseudoduganella umbonata]